jgi:hypothetical protein
VCSTSARTTDDRIIGCRRFLGSDLAINKSRAAPPPPVVVGIARRYVRLVVWAPTQQAGAICGRPYGKVDYITCPSKESDSWYA